MAQQQFKRPGDEQALPARPNVLDELERRKEEVAGEREEEQRRDAALDAERNRVAEERTKLQERIDQLLSSSPEDFVIRFVQTEGQ